MGGGSYSSSDFVSYSTSVGRGVTKSASTGRMVLDGSYSAQEMFKSRRLDEALNPKGVIRECCDSEEHPNTIPVMIFLDVTGSMGSASVEVAKKLGEIVEESGETLKDVEFLMGAIGDYDYDDSPLQVTQFESDVRINVQLDKVYFEGGGGGNDFESYTAAWYFGLHHTKLDCWNRGKKGIIITLGDEPLNPYLPAKELSRCLGENLQSDIETDKLYKEVIEKFDVYHLAVDDPETSYKYNERRIKETFGKYLDENHLKTTTLNALSKDITNIIREASLDNETVATKTTLNEKNEIVW